MDKKVKLIALICGAQLGIILIICATLWGVKGEFASFSLLIGGLISIGASIVIALKVVKRGVISTPEFIRRYYSGHMLKLAIVALSLIVVFKFKIAEPAWVVCGLVVVQISYLIIVPFVKRATNS